MKITDIISESTIGTEPKRPARPGSRPDRGHETQPRYKTAEGADERSQNALWAQITAHEKAAKKSKDLKQQHHLKMADQLRSQLKTTDEGFDYTMKDLGNDYAGFPSNHSLKHKFLAKIQPEKRQLYKDKMNNTHEWEALFNLFKVAKARGDIIDQDIAENKAPRSLCVSSKPDEDLGASQLSSCKSQGLRARDGEKSHKLGKSPKSRVKVGGKRIKGNKYGGPLPDWS